MEIKLENLNLLEQIANDITLIKKEINSKTTKRWFCVKELAIYLSYSKDRIYKLKDDVFLEGIHFYKKGGRVLFDRFEIDKWVTTTNNIDTSKKVNDILNDIINKV